MILITICAVAWAAAATWKMRKLKKDVYDFADAVEGQLDALASGKEPEGALDMEDSLTGRISEKLSRISHIMERRAQESSQEKQQVQELIADISHQTRTPLANQKICLEILRDELQTLQESGETVQSALEFLDRLEHQTDKLDFLLESLVKMSRLETGIIQISKENQDLRPALERALSAAVPAASAKGIRLTAEIGEDGIFLPHDGKWTEEAVYNLLDNGVKYTSEGGRNPAGSTPGRDVYRDSCEGYGKGNRPGPAGPDIHPVLPGTGNTRSGRDRHRSVPDPEDRGASERVCGGKVRCRRGFRLLYQSAQCPGIKRGYKGRNGKSQFCDNLRLRPVCDFQEVS